MHKSEVTEQVRSTIATTLGIDEADLTDDTSQDTCGCWTSLQHMLLMVAIEDRFRLQLTMDEMLGMKSLQAIVSVVHGRAQLITA